MQCCVMAQGKGRRAQGKGRRAKGEGRRAKGKGQMVLYPSRISLVILQPHIKERIRKVPGLILFFLFSTKLRNIAQIHLLEKTIELKSIMSVLQLYKENSLE